jgi:PPM family protein phosphatase
MSADESNNVPHWFTGSTFRKRFDSPPPAPAVGVEFGAESRRGRTRATNEDHYLIVCLGRSHETLRTSLSDRSVRQRFDEFGYGLVVADGMGTSGEAAGRLAITTLVDLVISYGKWNLRIDEPTADEVMDRAERFYRGIDSTLLQASRKHLLSLQSALTAVYTAGNELFFAHTGSSRAYLCRTGAMLQLTRDHPRASGQLGTPHGHMAGAVPDDRRSQTISSTNGAGPSVDVEHCGLNDGDTLLLCTDGLTDTVDEARIASVLRLPITPDDQCRILVDLAIEAGSDDDVTALVARYRIPDDPSRP